MTANMTVLIAEKDNVLAVPSRAVLSSVPKSTSYRRRQEKTYHEVEVKLAWKQTGTGRNNFRT